jgi:hypothetical protein
MLLSRNEISTPSPDHPAIARLITRRWMSLVPSIDPRRPGRTTQPLHPVPHDTAGAAERLHRIGTHALGHAWALQAWHFANTMDVDTDVERDPNRMLRGAPTEQGRARLQRLDAQRVAPAMQATRPRRRQAASR